MEMINKVVVLVLEEPRDAANEIELSCSNDERGFVGVIPGLTVVRKVWEPLFDDFESLATALERNLDG